MTECTTEGITFSSQGRRQVTADFCGGDISSDTGVMLLREAERGLRLIERLSAVIDDPREPARITHEQSILLKQRVLAIALGYEDINDHTALRNDTLLRLGAADAMGSSPTLCRLENRIKEQQLGLFADRTSCHKFVANQFRVLLSAAAYVLVEHIRSTALRGTALASAQVTRIRLELFKIGARVLTSVRRIVIHLATACPAQDIFKLAAARLMAASTSYTST